MDVPPVSTPNKPSHGWLVRFSAWIGRTKPRGLFFFISITLVITGLLAWPFVQTRWLYANSGIPETTDRNSTGYPFHGSTTWPMPAALPKASSTPLPVPTLAPVSSIAPIFPDSPLSHGTLFLSLNEASYYHLFAFRPLSLPFTRLTSGSWDDITPAISPDNTRLAFASNRSGQWDLYLLDLGHGDIIQLSNTPEYEASPSWSPDGQYLAYETYLDGNLEIFIRAVNGSQAPFPLSEHPSADFAPAWSPQGRRIAFISLRSGKPDVWLADLNNAGSERFTNLSQNPHADEAHPAWSADGRSLAWAARDNGSHNLYVWEESNAQPRYVGSGDWAVWSPGGEALVTTLLEPHQTFLTAFNVKASLLALPPLRLPGEVQGLSWGTVDLKLPLPEQLQLASQATPAPLWEAVLTPVEDIPGGRQHLVSLRDVQAPYPLLHDLVDESFHALRARLVGEAGWDLLASLENAFVPITSPLPPGMGNDWLYTGRAFALNPLPISAGWVVVIPEQFGSQTYWRVFLRARIQDGAQGRPLQDLPWDLNNRYNGDPRAYETGGSLAGIIPSGYWLDFTGLAMSYGWERLPALTTWQSSFPAARFNEFFLSAGLEWQSAMLELYPPEALVTPTALIPPSLTPSPTSRWYQTTSPTQFPALISPDPALNP